MATIRDYLDWRGDVTMDYSPFNEVDNYILAKIGSPDLTGIVPFDTREMSLATAVQLYEEAYGEEGRYLGALAAPGIMDTFFRLPSTERFKDLRLTGYIRIVDEAENEQFSALTIGMPDGRYYVSFRGTDDTILAWRENLMMSVEECVPAQRDAADYLVWAAEHYDGPLIVGGHSKGGNLAVYAAVNAPETVQDRIVAVYSNDGPGFNPDFYDNPGYQRIRDRIHTILPRHSLVGTLLQQDDNITVVNDSCRGIGAHDGYSWQVERNSFVRSPNGLSRSSRSFDESMNTMIANMSIEDRKAVIDEIFDIIATTGSSTISEITERRWRQAKTMAKTFKNSPEVKKFVVTMAELLVKDYKGRLQADNKKAKEEKAESKSETGV